MDLGGEFHGFSFLVLIEGTNPSILKGNKTTFQQCAKALAKSTPRKRHVFTILLQMQEKSLKLLQRNPQQRPRQAPCGWKCSSWRVPQNPETSYHRNAIVPKMLPEHRTMFHFTCWFSWRKRGCNLSFCGQGLMLCLTAHPCVHSLRNTR